MIEVKVAYSNPTAAIPPILPTYATDGSGAFDIYSYGVDDPIELKHGFPITISTGLIFEIPEDHVMLLFSRSGQGFNHTTRLANCVGVIDADFRGELKIKLYKDWAETKNLIIERNDRIAQGIIIPRPKVKFVLADGLSITERGSNGFGSTGTK